MLAINCGDVGELASGRCCLVAGSPAWRQARLCVRLYRARYDRHQEDGSAMCHWLRVPQAAPGGVPHLLMVDDGRLQGVVRHLEHPAAGLT